MTSYQGFRRAVQEDVDFIIAREADPANKYIGRNDAATHGANINNDAFHYLIPTSADGEALGYAILKDEPDGRLEWRRLVIAKPGGGVGTAFMQDVLQHFMDTGTKAVWLDVNEHNTRARHIYERLGFQETHRGKCPVNPADTIIFMEYSRS